MYVLCFTYNSTICLLVPCYFCSVHCPCGEFSRACCQKKALMATVTQGNETLHPDWQKESWQTFEETSRYVRLERVTSRPTPSQVYDDEDDDDDDAWRTVPDVSKLLLPFESSVTNYQRTRPWTSQKTWILNLSIAGNGTPFPSRYSSASSHCITWRTVDASMTRSSRNSL